VEKVYCENCQYLQGDIFYSKVITDFAIEHSLDRGSISMCLKNKYAQLSGWTFEYINKEKV